MPTKEQIIEALRCSSTPDIKCKREECPYFCVEEINDPELAEQLGKEEFTSCDVEAIALDAADMLEGSRT